MSKIYFTICFTILVEVSDHACREKWGKVMTRSKVIYGPTGFNIQMTSFDKKTKVDHTTIRHILKWSPLILKTYTK